MYTFWTGKRNALKEELKQAGFVKRERPTLNKGAYHQMEAYIDQK